MTQAIVQPVVGLRKKVLLTGFSGAGKTEVGFFLQQRYGLSWVDLDQYIEKQTAKHVAEIIRVEGEEVFRKLEHESLKEVLAKGYDVISLGGGALAQKPNRELLTEGWLVVYLEASVDTLVHRLLRDEELARSLGNSASRPLLFQGDVDEAESLAVRVRELFELRREGYEQANIKVLSDYLNTEAVADTLMFSLGLDARKSLAIFPGIEAEQLGSVVVGFDIFNQLSSFLKVFGKARVCVLIDENVQKHWGGKLRELLVQQGRGFLEVVIPSGEASKRLEVVEDVCEQMLKTGLTRDDVVLGIGGGVVGDIAGLVSSLYMRGIRLLHLPTTVVAQVDSAIGGKTGVNLKGGKNTVGTFRSAEFTLIDPSVLSTLPEREFRSGLAEVVKYGLISRAELFEWFEVNARNFDQRTGEGLSGLIEKSVKTKLEFIVGDVNDLKGTRAKLNFGHTLGHAVEKISGYGKFLHGEAVSIGMVFALFVGEALGVSRAGLLHRTVNLLQQLKLPIAIPEELTAGAKEFLREKGISKLEQLFAADILKSAELSSGAKRFRDSWNEALCADKKRSSDSVGFVVISELGQAEIRKVEVERLIACIAWFTQEVQS